MRQEAAQRSAAAGSVEARIERAQASERAGRREAARADYEAALRRLREPSQASLAVDLTRWIGRTHLADGDLEAALDCAELSRAIAEANRNSLGVAHALNLQAGAQHQRGDLDAAVALYHQARAYGHSEQDRALVALIDMNLGAAANVRGDHAGALEHYRASLSGFRLSGSDDHVAHVLNNLGMLYTDQERWEEAEQAFSEALEICERVGDLSVRAVVEVNRSELWIARGALDRALEACDVASATMRRSGDARARGELQKSYGIIYRQRREYARAERSLDLAAGIARAREDLLLAGEVARERAELFRCQGRHRETLRELNLAYAAFQRLRARRDLADIGGRVASLEAEFVEIVRAWGESIESADQYTHGHCRRVAEYGCMLARAAGMDEQSLFWFRLGGLLHDVGKIVVPGEILNKPGRLTPEERVIVERHPDAGVELLGDLEFPWDIRPMVRHHHEQWGGGGYPARLAGEEIPLSARILCIADVYDALTSDRPYRAGNTQERALEIMRGMVSHFDPSLMELWEELCASGAVAAVASDDPRRDGVANPARAEHPSAEAVQRTTAAAPSVVVIARDPAEARWIEQVLARGGTTRVRMFCGETVENLLGRLGEQRCDAVLLHVPPDHAIGVGTLARVCEWMPEVPIIVLPEEQDDAFALRAIREGAQDCISRVEAGDHRVAQAIRYAIERSRLRAEERARSLVDDLTALYNRRGFFHVARQSWLVASRQTEEMVLFFVDLDELKQINDRFGHTEGDAALIDVAGLLRDTFRRSDVLARIGGDEFGILARSASQAYATAVVDRLRSRVEAHNRTARRPYMLSLSIGVAVFRPGMLTTMEDLVREADAAMYEHKRRRRDPSPPLALGR